MEITKKYLTQEKTVFHCKTEQIANALLKIAHSFGLKWVYDNSYLDTNNWKNNKNDTCYNFKVGKICTTVFYNSKGYTIIDANMLISKHKIELFYANN